MTATPEPDPWGIGFGLAAVAFAAVALLVWFPNDMRGGFIERSPAGDPAPGDAFFPTLLSIGILILGGLQALTSARSRRPRPKGRIDGENIAFLAGFVLVFVAGIALMAEAGPLLVALCDAGTYRALSDTAPWKYAGFILGGLLIGLVPVIAVERRLRLGPALVVIGSILMLIVIFDIMLADIRLPPNADV